MNSKPEAPFPEWKDAKGGLLARADAVSRIVNEILFGESTVLMKDKSSIISCSRNQKIANIWLNVVEKLKIPQNDRLYKACQKRSDTLYSSGYNPFDVFIETLEINKQYHCHNYLLERSKSESISYGTMPLYRWFATFAVLRQEDKLPFTIEMKYLSAFVKNIQRDFKSPPFKVKRKDLSSIEDIQKFYNLPNIIECLLNIMELRYMLAFDQITIDGQKHFLHHIIDELALGVAQSPKHVIKQIRNYLSFAVHLAGTYANRPGFLEHKGTSLASNSFATRYAMTGTNKQLAAAFKGVRSYLAMRSEGKALFVSLGLSKLWDLCDALLACNFDIPFNEQKSAAENFSRANAFLLSIMRIAGFGRGSKNLATAKSAPEPEDPSVHLPVAQKFEEYILATHRQAVQNGFAPETHETFVPTCISMWKTTGAGTQPVKMTLNIDGNTVETRSSKKNIVGPGSGDSTFRRATIAQKNSIQAPYKIGTRDVPYKPTRAIYPIPLHTIHAQCAVAMHMVKYISTSPKIQPMGKEEFSSGHVVTGSDDTSGVRIVDNSDTIIASGSPTIVSLDLDMSEFDAHNINSNFRSAIIRALLAIDSKETFGPDNIPYKEMVEYAFGSGYVHQTHWDAGRAPILALRPHVPDEVRDQMIQLYSLTPKTVGERINTISPTEGLAMLNPGTAWVHDQKIPIDPAHYEYFIAACVCDGTDLIFLESECSGELTTLLFNSLMNLAIQDIILEFTRDTKLGKSMILHKNRCIGDDVTIQFLLRDTNFTTQDVEDFLDACVAAVKSCGHVLNPLKTFFTFHKSEFVQTFGVKGLYIPKNQIMTIPSERPRVIEDPVGFSDGFRRLQLTKVARGESHDSAVIITAIHHAYVTRMRFHVTTFKFLDSFQQVGFADRNRTAPFSVNQFYLRQFTYKEHSTRCEYEDTIEVFIAPSMAMLPHSCGGIGLCETFLPIILYDALLIQELSRFSFATRKRLVALYACFKSARSRCKERVQDPQVTIEKINDKKADFLPLSLLFTPSQIKASHDAATNGIDLGRLSIERVPAGLLMKGLLFDPSVRKFRRTCEERNFVTFLLALQRPLTGIAYGAYVPDDYLIATEFTSTYISPVGLYSDQPIDDPYTISSFMACHDSKVREIYSLFGLPTPSYSLHSKVSRLRLIISREPVLRSVRSPEDVIEILTSYGIKNETDRTVAVYLLTLAGFIASIASQLVDEFLNSDSFIIDNAFFGSGTDDVLNLCDFISPTEFKTIGYPQEVPVPMRYNFYLHSKMRLLLACISGNTHNRVTEIRFIDIRKQADQFNDLAELRGVLTNYPRLKAYLAYVRSKIVPEYALRLISVDDQHNH